MNGDKYCVPGTPELRDDFLVLIDRHMKYQPPSGGEITDIVVQVGYPKWIDPEDFQASCPVAFRGGIGRVKDIIGVDPMHSLMLALLFVDSYLKRDNGKGKFFWSTGEDYHEE